MNYAISTVRRRSLLLSVVGTVVALLSLAAGAQAAMTVTHATHSINGVSIKITGDGDNDSVEISYSGTSYTFEATGNGGAISATSQAGCSNLTNPPRVTCDVGDNAIDMIDVDLNDGVDTVVALGSVPVTSIVRAVDIGSVSSAAAPLEAFVNESEGSVTGSPTHDYIEIAYSGGAPAGQINAGAGDDQITLSVADVPYEQTVEVSGGAGDDLIDASASTYAIHYEASAGVDIFIGGSARDQARTDGNDFVYGNGGSDSFYDNDGFGGTVGNQKFWGGPGADWLVDSDANATPGSSVERKAHFEGGSGLDSMNYIFYNNTDIAMSVTTNDNDANDGPLTIGGVNPDPADIDHVHPSVEEVGTSPSPAYSGQTAKNMTGNDSLQGSDGRNKLLGWKGTDTISGNGGADVLYGGADADTVHGNAGDDTILGADNVSLTDGADALYGESGIDTIYGGEAGDTIYGGDGGDTIFGARSTYVSGDGADTIFGDGGADTIDGSEGADSIYGGDGADTIRGDRLIVTNGYNGSGDAADTIDGGAGDDVIRVEGDAFNDTVTCGSGTDTVYANAGDSVDLTTCEVVIT